MEGQPRREGRDLRPRPHALSLHHAAAEVRQVYSKQSNNIVDNSALWPRSHEENQQCTGNQADTRVPLNEKEFISARIVKAIKNVSGKKNDDRARVARHKSD